MKISAGKSTGSRSHALFSVLIVFLLLFSSLPIASAEEAIEPTIEPIEVLNSPPVASDDAYTLEKGGTLDIPAPGVLANDVDAEGEAFTVTKLTDPAHGTLTLNADGSFTYVHDGSETLSDSFTYKASDGQSDSNAATVTLTIVTPNTPPVPSDDAYALDEGATLEIPAPGVLANDTDAEGDPLSALVLMDPVHGTLTLNADGSFTYVHDGSETLSDSFTYKASDGKSDLNSAVVTLTVNPVNDPPAAIDDSYTLEGCKSFEVSAPGILANDTDAEREALTVTKLTDPVHGTLILNPDGSFVYTCQKLPDLPGPASGTGAFAVDAKAETGPVIDSFTYSASDGKADSNIATVTIAIEPGKPAEEGKPEIVIDHNQKKVIVKAASDKDTQIESYGGKLKLSVPKGALDQETAIEMTDHGQWGPRAGGLLNVFEFNAFVNEKGKAEGDKGKDVQSAEASARTPVKAFKKGLMITIEHTPEDLAGIDIDTLRLYYLDEATRQWMPVDSSTFDEKTGILTATIDHFSYYGENAQPAIMGPGKVKAFQVDLHSGAAVSSYPIEVPPGSGGFQPSISLTYNSASVDEMKNKRSVGSWVGTGWSLGLGAISYDAESGKYSLAFSGGSYEMALDGAGKYHTIPESFYKITKTGQQWDVYDREGIYYRFGGTTDSQQYYDDSTYYRWDLSYMRDTNTANTITVTYVRDVWTDPSTGKTHVRSAYPSHVYYNNNHVDIVFNSSYDAEVSGNGRLRNDNPRDPKPKVIENRKLDSIEVKVDGNLVRKYVFAYTTTAYWRSTDYGGIDYSGKHTLTSIKEYGADGTSSLPTMSLTYTDLQTRLYDTNENTYTGNPQYSKKDQTHEWTDEYRGFSQVRATDAQGNYTEHYFYTTGDFPADVLTGKEYKTEWYNSSSQLMERKEFTWDYSLLSGSPFAYWALDENSGATAYDSAGSNHGTISGATWTTGKYGSALSFDGVNDYVDCGNSSIFNFGNSTGDGPFTLGAWVKRADLSVGGEIVSKYNSQISPRRQQYELGIPANGEVQFTLYDTSNDWRKGIKTTDHLITDYGWHHVTATYDGSETVSGLKIYIDGSPASTAATIDNASYVAMEPTTESLKIGMVTWSTGPAWYFKGSIDEVRVYGRALSEVEVKGGAFIYLSQVTDTIGSKVSRTSYTYGDYGNVVKELQEGDTSISTDDATVWRTFYPNTSANILSRPARERVYAGAQATDDGGTNLKKESLFYYDGNNTSQTTPPTVGNLTRVESKIDASNSVSGYYTYDSYGNVLTETDPRNKVWTTNYESTYHVFPAKIIAPDNSGSETYSFDVKTGNLLSRTDVNGQSTSYEYDTFGRLTGIKRPGPDGQPETIPSTQYQYNNWGTLNQQHLKSLGKVAEGDYLWSSQYFDGLGRVIQTQSRGETGRTIINSTTVYNNRGLVDKGYISQDYDSTQINGYTVLEPGLVAHWSMDEGSGTVARDNMGGNNVMISGATWTNGKENLALSFDGQDDYAQTTPNPSITGPITIQAWIRPNTSGKEMRFIHGGSQYLLSVRSDNKVSFSDALGHGVTTDAGVLTLNDWNHVIAVFTGTAGTGVTLENCNIYVNGVSRGTQATGTWSPGSAGTLKLGGNAEADEVEVLSDPGGWYGEGATRSRDWTISESKVITRIWTYHDNSVEGAPPNYIYIRKSSDGSIVWQGMSTGGEYHHWVYPGVTLPAGTYYCTDAAANWQKNQWGMGQTRVWGRNPVGNSYSGVMDEVKIWNRALSEQEVINQYQGEYPRFSTPTYDALGRVTSTTAADGSVTSTDYSVPWQTTVTNERGYKHKYYYDAFGRLTQVDELNASHALYATTTYGYDTLGNLKQVIDAQSHTTTMNYDWLGRKTSMTDPDMGTWSYTYDTSGNLTSQTDNKSQTITLSYDALNRLTGKTYPTGLGMTNVSYTYDSTTGGNYGKGRRTGMTDASGTTAYKYDARGRLIQEKRTISSVDYTTGFAYDAGNRLQTITYPTGETVTQSYNGRGFPSTLTGSTVYSNPKMSLKGS